ncbi:hypothetical protein GALMADRAFT_280870 [Galerina marginata CBS 339.88]|uniref:Uncharacterized protein n=1 Tax=Galerina marginata (strain CBS 339.88) TaxID=685588 RepID=A0A067T435_GALM3|nr:hypothetical protein GALMADRAFT_280870 [Galerina marginata CBS 339.88]
MTRIADRRDFITVTIYLDFNWSKTPHSVAAAFIGVLFLPSNFKALCQWHVGTNQAWFGQRGPDSALRGGAMSLSERKLRELDAVELETWPAKIARREDEKQWMCPMDCFEMARDSDRVSIRKLIWFREKEGNAYKARGEKTGPHREKEGSGWIFKK